MTCAGGEPLPEPAVVVAARLARLDEHAVVLADHLVAAITGRVQEVVVDLGDRAGHLELDDRQGAVDRLDLVGLVEKRRIALACVGDILPFDDAVADGRGRAGRPRCRAIARIRG